MYKRLILEHLQNVFKYKLRPDKFAFRTEHLMTLQFTKLTHPLIQNLNYDLQTLYFPCCMVLIINKWLIFLNIAPK